jgi:hypothetical protein
LERMAHPLAAWFSQPASINAATRQAATCNVVEPVQMRVLWSSNNACPQNAHLHGKQPGQAAVVPCIPSTSHSQQPRPGPLATGWRHSVCSAPQRVLHRAASTLMTL